MSSVKYRQDAPTFQGRKSTKHHEHAKEPTEKRPLFYLNKLYYRASIPRTGNGYRSSVLAVQAVSRSRRHVRTRGKNARAHVLNANALDELRSGRIMKNIIFLSRKETKGLEFRHLARYACTILKTVLLPQNSTITTAEQQGERKPNG